ncbi:MAG: hypothetical protein LBH19_05260 [Dysgonamonadaceae bacterium]|jgi:hypothetical protein|nr:hypothetical protein [Dysgonamonadaceae bacterium]
MIWILFFIPVYALSLITVIKAARTGKGLFSPNFRRIDEVYFLGAKRVWNTWWGKLGYYTQLLFHIASFIILLLFIFYGIYTCFQSR